MCIAAVRDRLPKKFWPIGPGDHLPKNVTHPCDPKEICPMNFNLTDKLALVTGSTKGIGYTIAAGLSREGARVIVTGRSQASVDEALARLRGQVPESRAEGYAGDLSNPQAVAALIERHPAVDVLVNNLGIFDPKPFEEISDDDWQRFFETNVMSGVRLSRA